MLCSRHQRIDAYEESCGEGFEGQVWWRENRMKEPLDGSKG